MWSGVSLIGQDFIKKKKKHWVTLHFGNSQNMSNPLPAKNIQFSSVQSLSRVRLFATLWTAAHQASLSITNHLSLLKLMSIALVMPSNHLSLCHPLLLLPSIFASIRVFSNESVLPMNIQNWFSLGWTGWISLQSKRLSRVFSNTAVQKHQFFGAQLYL